MIEYNIFSSLCSNQPKLQEPGNQSHIILIALNRCFHNREKFEELVTEATSTEKLFIEPSWALDLDPRFNRNIFCYTQYPAALSVCIRSLCCCQTKYSDNLAKYWLSTDVTNPELLEKLVTEIKPTEKLIFEPSLVEAVNQNI